MVVLSGIEESRQSIRALFQTHLKAFRHGQKILGRASVGRCPLAASSVSLSKIRVITRGGC